MESEMKNLLKACFIVAALLSYCYLISSKIPKGIMRLLTFLPVICIFVLLPLLLSSVMLQLGAGLIIAWLANFKLLLLALGPDDGSSELPLLSFILITALPIKLKQSPGKKIKSTGSNLSSPLTFAVHAVLWSFAVQMYVKKPYKLLSEPIGILFLFTLRTLLSIQLSFTLFGVIANKILKHDLEPQFNKPHLASSLQDYWGKRWNRMTSSIMRSSVYTPTRSLFTPIIGRKWARNLAIIATFAVSGLMHEMVYLYGGLGWPTWEVTWFFVINGVCVAIEIDVKKKASEIGWVLHPMISRLLTLGFITVTTTWLCCTEQVRSGMDVREIEEYAALANYAKNVIQFKALL